MKTIFLSIACITIICSSCHLDQRKIGAGPVTTVTRSVGSFNSVEVRGDYIVYLSQDSFPSVNVETDESLHQYIEITNEGETLVIGTKKGFVLEPSTRSKIYLAAPLFKKLDASGRCNIVGQTKINSSQPFEILLAGASGVELNITAPFVKTNSAGATTIQLKGQTKDFSVNGAGSTEVRCSDLMAENVDIHISGAGQARVFASVKLNVTVSGSGDVKYKGNAAVTQKISGSGSVEKDLVQ